MVALSDLSRNQRVRLEGRLALVLAANDLRIIVRFEDNRETRKIALDWSPDYSPDYYTSPIPPPPLEEAVEIASAALTDDPPISLPSPFPNDQDISLARRWAGGDRNLHRMLSARLAERAIASQFAREGRKVIDVSITQLTDNNAQREWLTHDLEVDGHAFDVKNATRSEHRENRYVAHCVPQFKETRDSKTVTIVGTVAYWSSLAKLQSKPLPYVFLGTTDAMRVDRLRTSFSRGPLRISLTRGIAGPKFLPPWLFDYPPSYYFQRDVAVDRLRELAASSLEPLERRGLRRAPFLLAGVPSMRDDVADKLTAFQQGMLTALLKRLEEGGRTLAVVFLTILEGFVKAVKSGQAFPARQLEPLLFPNQEHARPILLHDPLQTIHGLIETLSIASTRGLEALRAFDTFELYELNILRGKRPGDSEWRTVVAYCGGWEDGERGIRPCGNIPLVIGQNQLCNSCLHLICERCSFCSIRCQGDPFDDAARSGYGAVES
ncbi:MAG TPA: hypothetical protein VM327_02865 [Candidatus Thermoplasmatota archaeon]|nr:hypothetical protein [Candidatus Thermoplasmatota archaeon]